MHFLKKGQTIRAWVLGRPPPLIRAMPERKRFFSTDVFPKAGFILRRDIPFHFVHKLNLKGGKKTEVFSFDFVHRV